MGGFGRAIAWIAAIAIGSAIWSGITDAKRDDSGTIVDSGNIDVFKIKVGDCLSEAALVGETVSDAKAIPCDEPHLYQAYYSTQISDGTYPTDVSDQADQICYDSFYNVFDIYVDETVLTYMTLYPTQGSWDKGDREITCLLSNMDETLLTESFM